MFNIEYFICLFILQPVSRPFSAGISVTRYRWKNVPMHSIKIVEVFIRTKLTPSVFNEQKRLAINYCALGYISFL